MTDHAAVIEKLIAAAERDPYNVLAAALEKLAEIERDRDRWIRLFNRLQGAVQHHKDAHVFGQYFTDVPDEALWKAMDRVLADTVSAHESAHGGHE